MDVAGPSVSPCIGSEESEEAEEEPFSEVPSSTPHENLDGIPGKEVEINLGDEGIGRRHDPLPIRVRRLLRALWLKCVVRRIRRYFRRPTPPSYLQARRENGFVRLSWHRSNLAISYSVERSPAKRGR